MIINVLEKGLARQCRTRNNHPWVPPVHKLASGQNIRELAKIWELYLLGEISSKDAMYQMGSLPQEPLTR